MTKQVTQHQHLAYDEIDLRELFDVVWKRKWVIIITTFLFAVASVIYALSLPDVYKSETLLAPISEENSMRIPGQLGGLAALAGVNLGNSGKNTGLALEVIKSRDFIGRFITKYDLLIPIMAAKGWSRADDSLLIDPDIYDVTSRQWVRIVKPPFQPQPSLLEAYEVFLELLSVSQDKESGMIKLSLLHYSPYLAQHWVYLLVNEINEEMRKRELIEAQDSITYLTGQLDATNIADIRTMLFSLIEEQTKTVMLANVREEYVFRIVDPAVVEEKKSKPSRALICISISLVGLILSSIFVFFSYLGKRKVISRV